MYTYVAKCTNVVDGDTYDFEVDLGFGISFKMRARHAVVDTPEIYGVKSDSPERVLGEAAKARVEELILDKSIILVTKKDRKGKYGRYLCEVRFEHEGQQVELGSLLAEEGLIK